MTELVCVCDSCRHSCIKVLAAFANVQKVFLGTSGKQSNHLFSTFLSFSSLDDSRVSRSREVRIVKILFADLGTLPKYTFYCVMWSRFSVFLALHPTRSPHIGYFCYLFVFHCEYRHSARTSDSLGEDFHVAKFSIFETINRSSAINRRGPLPKKGREIAERWPRLFSFFFSLTRWLIGRKFLSRYSSRCRFKWKQNENKKKTLKFPLPERLLI
jgi:hypothetical protein